MARELSEAQQVVLDRWRTAWPTTAQDATAIAMATVTPPDQPPDEWPDRNISAIIATALDRQGQ